MKEYLKMSNIFEGKIISEFDCLTDYSGEPFGEVECRYAAHAINSHDELVAEVERLRGTLQQCVDALYIADKFCGNHTADECGDEIAIPISDALVAASKIVAPSNLGVTND